jgi:outer membrane protein assembly factor BamB
MKHIKSMKSKNLFLPAFGVIFALTLSGCGKIDNFMLGKDNTPEPAQLESFEPTLNVSPKWQANAGSGTDGNRLEMSPALDTQAVYTADVKGRVMAFDRETGKKLWETDLNKKNSYNKLLSGPSVGEGVLAVTNKDAQVIVFDSSTGEKLWQKTVSNEVLAPPTIAEGKVFVKTVDGYLDAFDARSGERVWTYNHESMPLIMRAGSSAQVLFGIVVAGFADGKLVGLRADTGQLLWEKPLAMPQGASDVERMADIDANPIISDGVVYVASYQQNVSAMSLQTGEIIWKKENISTFDNMALDTKALYVVDSDSDIWSVDRSSGSILWQQKDFHNRRLTSPVIVNDKALVFGDYQGYVSWVSLEDGHQLARVRPSSDPICVEPVVDGDWVYVLTSDGNLTAYQILDSSQTGNETSSSESETTESENSHNDQTRALNLLGAGSLPLFGDNKN